MNSNFDLINKNYLIVNDKVDQLGDLSCGFKVIHDLHEKMGVPRENIYVVSNDLVNCQLFNKYHFIIAESTLEIIQQIITESNIHLQITTSTDMNTVKHKFTGRTPVLALCEYDFDVHEIPNYIFCKSLGLGKNSIGVMIDHSLKEWGFSDDAKDPLKRLYQLKNTNDSFQKAILGKKSYEEFAENSCLYSSYARFKILAEYIKNTARENSNEKKDMVFVLPQIGMKELKKLNLDQFGVGSLKVIKLSEEGVSKEKVAIGKGKKLKVISGRISHGEMKTLFKAVHPHVIVTGDQSLSEAISANLNFIYSAADHKRKLQKNLENLGYTTYEYENYFTFKVPQIKKKDLTKLNQNVCSNYDYLLNFTNSLKEVFNAKFEPVISLEELGEGENFISSVKKDQMYLVTVDQICSLHIQLDTDRSLLSQFSDSIFEHVSLGYKRYLVKRNSLT